MSETPEFITHDFNLPCHDNELSKAGDVIEKLKLKLTKHITTVELITDSEFVVMYEEIIKVLDYVGRLSMSAFAIEEELEQMYVIKFKHSPQLAKKLWLDHYENVHHPYTILKNRCFKLLEQLDGYYEALYDKKPPNWNL